MAQAAAEVEAAIVRAAKAKVKVGVVASLTQNSPRSGEIHDSLSRRLVEKSSWLVPPSPVTGRSMKLMVKFGSSWFTAVLAPRTSSRLNFSSKACTLSEKSAFLHSPSIM